MRTRPSDRDAEQAPAEWRERHATDFNRNDVAELRLIAPGRTVLQPGELLALFNAILPDDLGVPLPAVFDRALLCWVVHVDDAKAL